MPLRNFRRVFFIINPKSGSSVSVAGLRDLRDYLLARSVQIRMEKTLSLPHAGQLAQKACHSAFDLVVVAGGDGTVRTVAQAMAGSDIPLLIVPRGTENLMAVELGLNGTVENTVLTLEQGSIKNLDLARANDSIFMAVAGVGFDAEVIRRINRFRKGHITHGDYAWPICRTFWEYKFPPVRVVADGKLVCNEPALVFVSNISRYAVGLGISLAADFSDGWLDLCIYKCSNQLRLLLHACKTVLKSTDNDPLVYRRRCKELDISSPDSDIQVQLDGDPGPAMPLHIEIIPAAAKVLVPPKKN